MSQDAVVAEPVPASVDLVLASTDSTAKSQELVESLQGKSVEEAVNTFSAVDLLQGATLESARKRAAELYPKMRDNSNILLDFGLGTKDKYKQIIEQILRETKGVDTPEMHEYLNLLNRELKGLKVKYDPSDPKVLEKYKQGKTKILGIFRAGKTMLMLLAEDIQKVETKIEKAEKTFKGLASRSRQNMGLVEQLCKELDKTIDLIIYDIAVLQLVHELAQKDLGGIVVGDASKGDRGEQDKTELSQFVFNVQGRVNSYKDRYFMAVASLQRNSLSMVSDFGLASMLQDLSTDGITNMQEQLAEWRRIAIAREAIGAIEAGKEFLNNSQAGLSEASRDTAIEATRVISEPVLRAETIVKMAEDRIATIDGMIAAIEQGDRLHEERDRVFAESEKAMGAAQERLSEAMVQRALESKPLDIVKTVPKLEPAQLTA